MDLRDALEHTGLTAEAIAHRAWELRSLKLFDETQGRAFELTTWLIALLGRAPLEAVVAASGELGISAGEAMAAARAKAGRDRHALASLSAMAAARRLGVDAPEAMELWRQAAEGYPAAAPRVALDTELSAYMATTIDALVRCEMAAKVDLYCKAGWLAADLSENPATDAALRVKAAIESGGSMGPGAAADLLNRRFCEVSLDLKVFSRFDRASGVGVFVAVEGSALPAFAEADDEAEACIEDPKASGRVDLAVRIHGSTRRAMIGSIAMNDAGLRQGTSFMRNAAAIEGGIHGGLIRSVDSVAEFIRYALADAGSFSSDRHRLAGAGVDGFEDGLPRSIDLVHAMEGLDGPLDHALFTPRLFLSASLRAFGAADPWNGLLAKSAKVLRSNPSLGVSRLVCRGLAAASHAMLHLGRKRLLNERDDSLGVAATSAAIGLVKAFGDAPGLKTALARMNRAAISLKKSTRGQGLSTYAALTDGLLCDVDIDRAREKAMAYRVKPELVALARDGQARLCAELTRDALLPVDGRPAAPPDAL